MARTRVWIEPGHGLAAATRAGVGIVDDRGVYKQPLGLLALEGTVHYTARSMIRTALSLSWMHRKLHCKSQRKPRCTTFIPSALLMVGAFALGCGPGEARAPNALRPIDEARAINLIARTLQQQGLTATQPRTVKLDRTTELRIDVSVEGRQLGIVYLTSSDVEALQNNPLAKRDAKDDRLIIRTGTGNDSQLHFVVLYASDYSYDDNVGEDREATSVTAENRLERDVRDFIVIAKKNQWP